MKLVTLLLILSGFVNALPLEGTYKVIEQSCGADCWINPPTINAVKFKMKSSHLEMYLVNQNGDEQYVESYSTQKSSNPSIPYYQESELKFNQPKTEFYFYSHIKNKESYKKLTSYLEVYPKNQFHFNSTQYVGTSSQDLHYNGSYDLILTK